MQMRITSVTLENNFRKKRFIQSNYSIRVKGGEGGVKISTSKKNFFLTLSYIMKIDFVPQWKDVIFQKQKKDNFSSQKQKDNRDKLLYYTLGGLALAAAGAVLYNKKADLPA